MNLLRVRSARLPDEEPTYIWTIVEHAHSPPRATTARASRAGRRKIINLFTVR